MWYQSQAKYLSAPSGLRVKFRIEAISPFCSIHHLVGTINPCQAPDISEFVICHIVWHGNGSGRRIQYGSIVGLVTVERF